MVKDSLVIIVYVRPFSAFMDLSYYFIKEKWVKRSEWNAVNETNET